MKSLHVIMNKSMGAGVPRTIAPTESLSAADMSVIYAIDDTVISITYSDGTTVALIPMSSQTTYVCDSMSTILVTGTGRVQVF